MPDRVPLLYPFPLQVLRNRPLRYYRGNDKSGTVLTDLGSQKQNGTIGTGVTLNQTGLLAHDPSPCMLFGAGTGITIPVAGLPYGNEAFTIECISNFAVLPGINMPLVEFGTNAGGELVGIYEYFGLKYIANWNGGYASGVLPIAGHTYYTAYTYDGMNLSTIYQMDLTALGVLNTGTSVQAVTPTLGTAYIGHDVAGDSLVGSIQDIAIYDQCLTATQVAIDALAAS